ncbi:probable glutamate receptor [Lineus longissimus]|uniref:probable glutamate receptor n=1 Tax=Lineus longissimus TaxID=88925 RepID=UPI002B4F5EBC
MATIVCILALLAACGSAQGQTRNKTNLIVTTILHEPFLQQGENEKFEGFIVDLLDRVVEKIGCTYTLKLVKDGKYGSPSPDGKTWSGMIGEIKRGEADLAAAALTMTSLRRAHIDYSFPFLANSLSVLMRRKDIFGTATEAMFGLNYFLTPFSAGVWMLIIVSFLTVSLGFILLNLFNPYEWRQRIQRGEIKDSEETNDQFGVKESLWFSYSMLVLQGYSKRPLSIAGRVLAVFWMFFIILTLGSYIALMVRNPNLVLNTQSGADMTVKGLYSFYNTDKPPIITLRGGSTYAYIKNTRSAFYTRIYQKMVKNGFANSTKQGIERVKSEGVAFLMETTMANYVVYRDCELTQLGEEFARRHYAFAMKKNDELRHEIDQAILELSEDGAIERMRWIWWRVKSPARCRATRIKAGSHSGNTLQADRFTKTSGLALQAFGGPLVFLLIGLIITALVCVGEILVFKHYDKSPGVPFTGCDENERA